MGFMTRDKLERIAVPLLIERFTAIGVDQDEALLRGEYGKFNRPFDEDERANVGLMALIPHRALNP